MIGGGGGTPTPSGSPTSSPSATPSPSPLASPVTHIYAGGKTPGSNGLPTYWVYDAQPSPTYWNTGTQTAVSTYPGSVFALGMNADTFYAVGTQANTDTPANVFAINSSTTTEYQLAHPNAITAMTVTANGDVYTVGAMFDSGFNAYPGFWYNFSSQPVQLGTNSNASATAIAVYAPPSGDTIVYVAGAVPGSNALLWKYNLTTHTLINTLTLDTQGSYNIPPTASAVAVDSAGNVVVGGSDNQGYLVYWKNGGATHGGETVRLTAVNGNNSAISTVYLHGTDIYLAGSDSDSNASNIYHAAYWKNGTKIVLDSGSTKNFADALYISSTGDVYAAGTNSSGHAVVWVNGGSNNGGQDIVSTASTQFTSVFAVTE